MSKDIEHTEKGFEIVKKNELDFDSGEVISPPNFDPENTLDTSGSVPKVIPPKDFTHQLIWSTFAGAGTKKITAEQKELIDWLINREGEDTYSAVLNGTLFTMQKIIKL